MRLVVTYTRSDGCTYSFQVIEPVEYLSAEDFIVDFEALCKSKVGQDGRVDFNNDEFSLANKDFSTCDFFYMPEGGKKYELDLPEVLTLDEWFEKNKS